MGELLDQMCTEEEEEAEENLSQVCSENEMKDQFEEALSPTKEFNQQQSQQIDRRISNNSSNDYAINIQKDTPEHLHERSDSNHSMTLNNPVMSTNAYSSELDQWKRKIQEKEDKLPMPVYYEDKESEKGEQNLQQG